VLVFIASSIIHMALQIHKREYKKLPEEKNLLEAMLKAGIPRGEYMFPCAASLKDAKTPEMQEKYRKGPCGFMTIVPSGVPSMFKNLVLWFLYSVLISVFVAYVAGRTLGPGTEYLPVFRVAGGVAIIAYTAGHFPGSIWKGTPWGTTLKHVLDGVLYGLLTAGVFGWLWPN
jgi:hypothetical protein